LESIRNEYLAGCYQQLVVSATGTGKAVILANIKSYMSGLLHGKLLVFAHRDELVNQLVDTMREWNPTLKVGKEMSDDYADADCDVVVSCNASIGRSGAARLARFGTFDIVVCDEAHHSIASTYLNVFEQTEVLKPYSTKLLVGFTATPKRKNLTRAQQKNLTLLDDEELISLKSVYKKIVFSYPIRKAIKEGWLVPLRGFRIKTKVDLSTIKTVAGDYQQDELATAVNTRERNAMIAEAWLRDGEGRQTVGFCVDIQHAKDAALAMRNLGIKAEAVWGTDPERASKLKRHQDKEITVLFNAQVLTEGYDDWRISCIIDAAPTKSPTKYTQCIGRGTRLEAGTGNLLEARERGVRLTKQDCIVMDIVDNNKRCTLVTLPTMVGLNPDMDLQGESVTKVAEKIEALQEKYPTVDLSQLVDVRHIETYIESIDLFAEPYAAEIKDLTKLTWMSTADGAYALQIPESQDITGQYARYQH
jgi:ATP-dependent helicase IRC3